LTENISGAMRQVEQQSTKSCRVVGIIATLTCCAATGCNSGPKRIAPPDADPGVLAAKLVEDYDANSNGSLAPDELGKAPSLVDMFDAFDVDGNKELSSEELEGGLSRVFDGRTGVLGATCRVTRNGKPVSGATVYFVPEPFLEGVLPVAGGITAANGVADLSVREEDLPANAPKQRGLMRAGLYFVEVTHPTIKIPEKYNKATTLGKAVCPEVTIKGPIQLALNF
jgi:hypothetical protein